MFPLIISRPSVDDISKIHDFFNLTIKDTFIKNNIPINPDCILQEEIMGKMKLLQDDFETQGELSFFLIAKYNDNIIATVALRDPSSIIKDNIPNSFISYKVISTVFVHPEFQNKGIGKILFNSILLVLHGKNIKNVCLDSGYQTAQGYWKIKLGEPNIVLEKYWDDCTDHLIWTKKLSEIKIDYKFIK